MTIDDPREHRSHLKDAWRRAPFLLWLVVLWMLLWGQFTVLAFVTGLVAALVVTTVFRLPPVELSGRINLWYGLVFLATFVVELVRGSLTVAWQVLDFRRQPGAAIVGVQLRTDDDLIMAHTAITCSLIPGSLVLEATAITAFCTSTCWVCAATPTSRTTGRRRSRGRSASSVPWARAHSWRS